MVMYNWLNPNSRYSGIVSLPSKLEVDVHCLERPEVLGFDLLSNHRRWW